MNTVQLKRATENPMQMVSPILKSSLAETVFTYTLEDVKGLPKDFTNCQRIQERKVFKSGQREGGLMPSELSDVSKGKNTGINKSS